MNSSLFVIGRKETLNEHTLNSFNAQLYSKQKPRRKMSDDSPSRRNKGLNPERAIQKVKSPCLVLHELDNESSMTYSFKKV